MLPKYRKPTHPGEMLLKEFINPMKITQKELACHLGWTYARSLQSPILLENRSSGHV